MYGDVIKKIVLIGGMSAALLCLVMNLVFGRDLATAAHRSLWVMLIVAILLHVIMRAIARVLMRFLEDQRRQAQLTAADSSNDEATNKTAAAATTKAGSASR